jgi:hypothetical protein
VKEFLIEYKTDDDLGWKALIGFDVLEFSLDFTIHTAEAVMRMPHTRAVRVLELETGKPVERWGDQEVWRKE